MSSLLPFLAELDPEQQALLPKTIGHTSYSQTAIIFGSLAAVGMLSMLFIYLFRKQILRRRKHRPHRRRSERKIALSAVEPMADEGDRKSKRKWRRLRRPHRPANPTLAQTHGLPPIRDEGTPPPGL